MDAREIISKLTLMEKAALLSGKNEWESRDIPRLGIQSITFSDGPHGLRRQEGTGDHLIVLLDIQMKHLDGMAAAKKIRKLDSDVIIIFITSTVQYAVQGYAVDALGYVLKPVPFTQFEQLFDKAIARVKAKQQHVYIKVSVEDKQIKLDCDSIFFIESQRNNVIIHCDDADYTTLGPLKKFEEMLAEHGFSKCHNAYLINLSFVEAVQKEYVILSHKISLPISRARKKEFMSALTEDIL